MSAEYIAKLIGLAGAGVFLGSLGLLLKSFFQDRRSHQINVVLRNDEGDEQSITLNSSADEASLRRLLDAIDILEEEPRERRQRSTAH